MRKASQKAALQLHQEVRQAQHTAKVLDAHSSLYYFISSHAVSRGHSTLPKQISVPCRLPLHLSNTGETGAIYIAAHATQRKSCLYSIHLGAGCFQDERAAVSLRKSTFSWRLCFHSR